MRILPSIRKNILFALIQVVLISQPVQGANSTQLPIVDLGYELHQALSYNATSDIYLFSNIRYAQAPVGNLRFRAPRPPLINRTIQTGEGVRACPQGVPDWQGRVLGPLQRFDAGLPFSYPAWEAAIANSTVPNINYNANTSEDCLFLDVYVPGKVFQQANNISKGYQGAPVLTWIHGGGFVFGSKAGAVTPGLYNPAGMLQFGEQQDGKGMIFVAPNYRLGAFGFLAGPEVATDGIQNAGLYDQRLALEWIQLNIHLFGGSPKRVTVLGESAGAGSALLQTTAYGGAKAPFSQVIGQSNFLVPTLAEPVGTTKKFLASLNVTNLANARQLPSAALIQANAQQIAAANWSSFIYGPVVDYSFVPALPSRLLKAGAFDKSINYLTGHNSWEGGLFLDPFVQSDSEFLQWLTGWIGPLTPSHQNYILQVLYPPIFDGSFGYVDQGTRAAAIFGDLSLDCNALYLNNAFSSQSYAYEFAVPPGLHSEDLVYTFSPVTSPALYPIAQSLLQESIVSFAFNGIPKNNVVGAFPRWSSAHKDVRITANSSDVFPSAINATRCSWWQDNVFV